ncbi:MAG: SPFH domain-containing protein [Rickettsiales bacterium]|jgi:regulator of protease activity HflC (stomatin/prohibitin superfamily)|nr:SPFH domain-containing protein [Rickettsiales bacterium]
MKIVEKEARHISGAAAILWIILAVGAVVAAAVMLPSVGPALAVALPFLIMLVSFLLLGFAVVKPNEAAVFTFFGRYTGTLRREGFYYVNPLATTSSNKPAPVAHQRLSLKTSTLQNHKQKINDGLGNPIEVGIVVIWRVVDTARAVFAVDNYMEFLSIQSDSALRHIVSLYPYDTSEDKNAKSLRGNSEAVSESIKKEIQEKVAEAGIEIIDAKITHLAYAPEIALAMLQRQQAAAVVAARELIVKGAVGMVETALKKLEENKNLKLSDDKKAQMVGNLLVVLCGNKDVQPVVNGGES